MTEQQEDDFIEALTLTSDLWELNDLSEDEMLIHLIELQLLLDNQSTLTDFRQCISYKQRLH